jgi:signal transduction histidine kinase
LGTALRDFPRRRDNRLEGRFPSIRGWDRILVGLGVALAALAGSFALWDPLEVDERAHVRRITQHAAEGVRADLEAEMGSLVYGQRLMARLWGRRQGLGRSEWEREAELFLDYNPSFMLIEWHDPDRGVRWSRARRGADPAAVLPVGRAGSGWTRAPPAGAAGAAFSPFFLLTDGSPGSRVVVPVAASSQGGSGRCLVVVVDLQTALAAMLSDHRELGYSMSVREGDTVFYRTPGTRAEDESEWGQEATPRLAGVSWRLRVWPAPELLEQMRSSLPELAVALGGLLGWSVVLAIRFARAARERSRWLGRARDEVERRVKERTAELRRANESLRREVAERARAERELGDLSGRLLRLQDEERRRLARELHDSTAQLLGAAAIGLDRAKGCIGQGRGADAGPMLEDSARHVEHATREIRTLSFLLHPPMLDDLGLEAALRWYTSGFSRRSGIAISLDVPPDLGRMPETVELTVYRIVQEALANVRRHSGSASASITLFRDLASLTLEIADRGSGFRLAVEGLEGPELGVGITGMRERVRQLGGQIAIRGDDGGTVVRVELPLAATSLPADPSRNVLADAS